ncbi:MAG TPA: glycosyltransferase family 2 protein [Gaiellaceae bacterium]|nr:glycosyltransferase family 2 protein [Gaiellaceae bacterium]
MTPVRNESWILDAFLAAAEQWADYIVVADQRSTDGSREIAGRHPKVVLVDNDGPADEQERQRLLIRTARELTGERRVLLALDADEFLSSNAFANGDWSAALEARPGTSLRWRWANVLPGCKLAWVPPPPLVFGLVDDGREHSGPRIHAVRVPIDSGARDVLLEQSYVVHLAYLDWAAQKRKQAWYQCWETLDDPAKRARVLYREYHQLDVIPRRAIRPFDPAWIAGYEHEGIDVLRDAAGRGSLRDCEVLDWFAKHGTDRFAKLDIWGGDWDAVAERHGHALASTGVADPRTRLDRSIHGWLRLTQRFGDTRLFRQLDRGLRLLGW